MENLIKSVFAVEINPPENTRAQNLLDDIASRIVLAVATNGVASS